MKSPVVGVAVRCVRWWTWFYTCQLPPACRDVRRAEIESDLWELVADADCDHALFTASHILLRLLLGIPDDFGWCMEQATAAGVLGRSSIALSGRVAGAALAICALWVIGLDANRRHPVGAAAQAAQSSGAESSGPRFEVASVKPNPAGRAGMTRSRIQPGGRFVAENMAIVLLIGQAYQVQAYQLVGGPGWIWSDGFDIDAKANGELVPTDGRRPLQGALRGLLADRFKLVTHTETRQLPVYALVLARSDGRLGPDLIRSSRTNCDAILAEVAAAREPGGPPPPPPASGQAPPCGGLNRNGMFSLDSTTPTRLANSLSAELNRRVFDRTGLTGLFNVHLTWTPDPMPSGPLPPDVPPIDPSGPSIFTAVQEQLGLKLESTTGPVDVLVIDRAERPTPN